MSVVILPHELYVLYTKYKDVTKRNCELMIKRDETFYYLKNVHGVEITKVKNQYNQEEITNKYYKFSEMLDEIDSELKKIRRKILLYEKEIDSIDPEFKNIFIEKEVGILMQANNYIFNRPDYPIKIRKKDN